ncbi:hypothetical protein TSAR_008845 [Trichomalopsis sarcophagae]|uniref:Uncharacterized protein n=1 Tax=Trichomalopsis sarcophagae TaxID=543379 RepID=A0A232EFZ4_9HYME|nr:hypothetical protein TSAR_008845 [Trichomalopsis sarcophagae]
MYFPAEEETASSKAIADEAKANRSQTPGTAPQAEGPVAAPPREGTFGRGEDSSRTHGLGGGRSHDLRLKRTAPLINSNRRRCHPDRANLSAPAQRRSNGSAAAHHSNASARAEHHGVAIRRTERRVARTPAVNRRPYLG